MVELEKHPRWVTQTTFYDPNSPNKGNCTEAAVASILNIPLEEVPNFRNEGEDNFWDTFEKFLLSKGFFAFLCPNFHPETLYLASGMSNRGVMHMVVYRDGDLYWDPHPSRSGIDKVEHTYTLIPLDPGKNRNKRNRR